MLSFIVLAFPCIENVGENYWGSRQQLRAGKVIADHIDIQNGALDPIYGVLLCPSAGKIKCLSCSKTTSFPGSKVRPMNDGVS